MSSKLTYLFMRGVIRFFTILRSNFLSFLTLITVIFMFFGWQALAQQVF